MLVSGLILKKNIDFRFLIMKMKKTSFMIKLVLVLDHIWIWQLSQNHHFPKMFNSASEKWIFGSHFHRNPDTSSGFFLNWDFGTQICSFPCMKNYWVLFSWLQKFKMRPHEFFSGYGESRYPGFWSVWTHFSKWIPIQITDFFQEKSVHKNFRYRKYHNTNFQFQKDLTE